MVEEFGLGLPPRIWGKKIGETLYSINWLPFGGFNKLHGEQDEEGITDLDKSFLHKNKKVRALVVVAGVIMNFLLAIVCFAVVYSFWGVPRETGKVMVVDISQDSSASTVGVIAGDQVLSVDGKAVKKSDDITSHITIHAGSHNLVILTGPTANRVQKTVVLDTKLNPTDGKYYMGLVLSSQEIYYAPVWQRPFYGIYYGFKDAIYWGGTIVTGLGGIATDLFKGHIPQGISGPIGVFAVTTEATKGGVLNLIDLVGVLSVNLAILNIFPFPALDGGRLLFIGIEAVTRKKISNKVEATIDSIGFMILLALILLISIGDIRRLIVYKGITGFINSLSK